jgi:hypothetical protein
MARASASTHARDFLNIADPDTAAHDLLDSALRSAVRDRASRRSLRSVEQWTFDQLQLLGVKSAQALSDDKVLDVLAAIRLVTAKLPINPRGRSTERFANRVAVLLDGLEPGFVPELLNETQRRIADEPGYAAKIADARVAMKEVHRSVNALRREVVDTIPPELADDPDLPIVLRQDDGGQDEATISILAVAFVIALTAALYVSRKHSDD